eukprot:g11798.t1
MWRQLKKSVSFKKESTEPITYDDVDMVSRKFTNYQTEARKVKMKLHDEFYETAKLKIFDVRIYNSADSATNNHRSSTTTKTTINYGENSSRDRILGALERDYEEGLPADFPLAASRLHNHQREAINIHLQQTYMVDENEIRINYDSFRKQRSNILMGGAYLEIPNTPLFKLATCSGKSLIESVIALVPASWIGDGNNRKFDFTNPDEWESRRTLITSPSGGLLQMAKTFRGYETSDYNGTVVNEDVIFSNNDPDDDDYIRQQNMKCLLNEKGEVYINKKGEEDIYECPYLNSEAQLLVHIIPGLKRLVWVKIITDEYNSRKLVPKFCPESSTDSDLSNDDRNGFTKEIGDEQFNNFIFVLFSTFT